MISEHFEIITMLVQKPPGSPAVTSYRQTLETEQIEKKKQFSLKLKYEVNGFQLRALDHKNNGKISNKTHIKFHFLFYADSLLHVSALLGHSQGDFQVVHYIAAVYGCPIVAAFLVAHICNLRACMCMCSWLVVVRLQPAKNTHAHTHTHAHRLQVWTTKKPAAIEQPSTAAI
jgi:hypothetical protein